MAWSIHTGLDEFSNKRNACTDNTDAAMYVLYMSYLPWVYINSDYTCIEIQL
jgi:hypothetical protein